jgi:hypothetical protein
MTSRSRSVSFAPIAHRVGYGTNQPLIAAANDGNDAPWERPSGRRTFGAPDDVSRVVMNRDGTRRRFVPER